MSELIRLLKPRKALNKAFLKVKPNRTDIEHFKENLILLLDRMNDKESEEFHKNLVSDFLKETYYKQNHFINTKGRNDLVIHNGDKAVSSVGVIIEAKSPTNKAEMLKASAAGDTRQQMLAKLNVKAFQELVLYYLRERIGQKNIEIKYLIATNINEWFIFDATLFDRLFAQNKTLVKQFTDFEGGRLADTRTDFFYKQIAEPFIADIKHDIEYTWFDIREYDTPLRNSDRRDDNKLIALYKLLSPEHLLKLPFANDSNSLDKRFYGELLHIIGLTEIKEGSKKLIDRNKPGERNTGSLLENAIIQLDSLDKINRLANPGQFGASQQERLFNLALELCITWINRVLFLKLLEAQLITYHKGDKSYEFLSLGQIKNYDDLNSLFFEVLARRPHERSEEVIAAFARVPYLNSSLFEPTEIEHSTLFISNLRDDKTIPLYQQTVLKDDKGKRLTGEISTLGYLFGFLSAYDFASEGSEDIQEDNKTLINASVLGLIFEKINGYKDGSFFTPGFITMYMCRETIRRAVVQKFNEAKGWDCADINELYDRIDDRAEANRIINSLKICDPAVGSGHFLVSALNEIIAVKNDLKILSDRDGRRLKEYHFEVVNDELIVTDEDGDLFEYNPNNPESQRVQEALFHEKQTIIESCLFGVDINPNSVKICRLRLWIELLKNAYYKTPGSTPAWKGHELPRPGLEQEPPRPGLELEPPRPADTPPLEGGELHDVLNAKSSPPFQGGVPEGGGGFLPTPEPRGGFKKLNNLPHLKTFRRELRNHLTPAEARLWTHLKGKALLGRKFRRQHSVANYILDFYCPEEHLAIELDGQGHFEENQALYDQERDLFLEHVGIRVLRFENKWVWDRPEELIEIVVGWFGKQLQPPRPGLEQEPPRPADTPPWKGGELHGVLHAKSSPPFQGGVPEGGGGFIPTPEGAGGSLETLPNIDINIKCGNSLISRFALDADLKQALKNSRSKWSIDSYRLAVDTYRNATSKEQKHEMERLINEIKTNFRSEISQNDPLVKRLRAVNGELFTLTNQGQLFELSEKELAEWNRKVDKLTTESNKLEAEIEAIKNNKIYENAFEWRFEFPEVLNDNGDFVGFDVVIGNPPYILVQSLGDQNIFNYYSQSFSTATYKIDTYAMFYELGLNLLSDKALLCYITPNTFLKNKHSRELRQLILSNAIIEIINFYVQVFEDASVDTLILRMSKCKFGNTNNSFVFSAYRSNAFNLSDTDKVLHLQSDFQKGDFELELDIDSSLRAFLAKIEYNTKPLGYYGRSYFGIQTFDRKLFVSSNKLNEEYLPVIDGGNVKRYRYDPNTEFVHFKKDSIKSGGDINVYKEYRIVVRQIGIYPEGTIVEPLLLTLNTIYNILLYKNNIPFLRFLLALINSRLFHFYWFKKYYDNKTTFPKIKKAPIESLPIKEPDSSALELFSDLVERVLENRMINIDTTDLESQIDQLVYQLYELTPEEIAIVENGVK